MMRESILICFALVVSVSAEILCGDQVCGPRQCCVTLPKLHCRQFSIEYDFCNMPREGAKSYAFFCPCDAGMVCDQDELYCVKNATVNTCAKVTNEAEVTANARVAVTAETGVTSNARAAVTAEAGAAPAVGPAGWQKCGDTYCPPWKCCVNTGKKHCTSLRGLNDLCSVPNPLQRSYPFMCPCQSGLTCNPDTWFCEKPQFFFNDIITTQWNQAQPLPSYSEQQVQAVSDSSEKLCGDRICHPWECCSTISKRHCRPLEKEHDPCTIPNEDTNEYGIYCPCEFGLTCNRKRRLCTRNVTGSTEAAATGQSGTAPGETVRTGGLQMCGDSICSPSQCCVTLGQPHCSPLAKIHQICGAYDDLEGNYPYFCPCEPGLKCNPVGWTCEVSEAFTNVTYVSVAETAASTYSSGKEVW